MRLARILVCVLSLLLAGADAVAQDGGKKKLIEFGWDEPDTAFMQAHVAEMEKTPFNGCVFHAYVTGPGGKQEPMLWQCWGRQSISPDQLRRSQEDLQKTQFHRFTDNFLRLNTTPGDVDWFDDFGSILNNVRLAAAFARQGKCRGILFDTEQYQQPLFTYSRQRDAKTKSWDQYAQQARKRGREVMQAFQEGYPDLTIFLTFGYTLPWEEAHHDIAKLQDARYGLLAPFLDGMLDAAKGKTRIVDGYEASYPYKEVVRFDAAYQMMSRGVLPLVKDAQKYHQFFSYGFGVWLDCNWRKQGWDPQDVEKNFYSPGAFENTVHAALARADEYVWIYSEQPRWWSAQGGPVKLPDAYEKSLRRAAASKQN